MKQIFSTFVAVAALMTTSFGQIKSPQPSPEITLKQAVGLSEVEIIYSRPGIKGRTIFGDVVPYNEVWRTGANNSTKIKLSDKVKIGGQEVPAGTFALYTIPGEEEWTVIIHKYLENWGSGGYDQTQDLCRFKVKPTKLTDKYETFTIDFSNFTPATAQLNLMWENTKISFEITTPTDEMLEKSIKSTLVDGPTAQSYAAGATYYLDKGSNLDQAITWIDKAIEKRPEAFWYVHTKAKILAKQGKKADAITTAKKSIELAKANKDGDFGYVKNNERLIEEINSKK